MTSANRSALSGKLSPILSQATKTIEKRSKAVVQGAFRARGYRIVPVREFVASARAIERRHNSQDRQLVERLRAEHTKPAFGNVLMWDLLTLLGQCVDPTDRSLGCVSQLTHALQVADSMHAAGVTDPDLIVAALVHDVGKLLMLTGADPAYICGSSVPIGRFPDRCGLDQCILNWTADQVTYMRLKDKVPDHLAWLFRYHSIELSQCVRLMDDRDLEYTVQYLNVFRPHDLGSKYTHHLPTRQLESYRELIESYFPQPILF
jgi:hypothetical protein